MENCCFIGHRFLAKGTKSEIKRRLRASIDSLIQQGVTSFICGGMYGFSMMAGLIVSEFKTKYSEIKLTVLLPCRDYWTLGYEVAFAKLLSFSDEVIYCAEGYYSGCRQKRNLQMLESSQYLVAYFIGIGDRKGVLHVAEEWGLTVINLAHSTQ